VEIPPGASDLGFFRTIAESLGVSNNLTSKAHQLRDRVEAVLHTNDSCVFMVPSPVWSVPAFSTRVAGRTAASQRLVEAGTGEG
jgi:hypothetical protein